MKTQWIIPLFTASLILPLTLPVLAEEVPEPRNEQTEIDPFVVQQIDDRNFFWSKGGGYCN